MKQNKSHKYKKQKGGAGVNPLNIVHNPLLGNMTKLENSNPIEVEIPEAMSAYNKAKKALLEEYNDFKFWFFKLPMWVQTVWSFIVFGIPLLIVIMICEILIFGINNLRKGLFLIIQPFTKLKGILKPLRIKVKKPKDIDHIWILFWKMIIGWIKNFIKYISK